MNEEQAKQLIRRQESIEKTLNLIYKDRDLMEDTHIRIGTLIDEVNLLKERVAKLEKNVVADVKDVSDKVDDVKDSLEGK